MDKDFERLKAENDELKRQIEQKNKKLEKLGSTMNAMQFRHAEEKKAKELELQKKAEQPVVVNFSVGDMGRKRERAKNDQAEEERPKTKLGFSKATSFVPEVFSQFGTGAEKKETSMPVINLRKIIEGSNEFGLTHEDAKLLSEFNWQGEVRRPNPFAFSAPMRTYQNPFQTMSTLSYDTQLMLEARCKSVTDEVLEDLARIKETEEPTDMLCNKIENAKQVIDKVLERPEMASNEEIKNMRNVVEEAQEEIDDFGNV